MLVPSNITLKGLQPLNWSQYWTETAHVLPSDNVGFIKVMDRKLWGNRFVNIAIMCRTSYFCQNRENRCLNQSNSKSEISQAFVGTPRISSTILYQEASIHSDWRHQSRWRETLGTGISPNSNGTNLLLAQASNEEQKQSGKLNRVLGLFLFLQTNDFWRDYELSDGSHKRWGINQEPRVEEYAPWLCSKTSLRQQVGLTSAELPEPISCNLADTDIKTALTLSGFFI